MLLEVGGQDRIIQETTVGPGTTIREFSIQSDTVLVSLFVNSVTSGSLDVVVYTLTDEGKEKDIITFPTVAAPSAELTLKKAELCLSRVKIVVTYTGICDYEIYGRAVNSSSSGGGTSTEVTVIGGVISVIGPTTPLVERLTVAAADTEFSYVLPALVKRLMIITETGTLKVGYVSGQSGVNYIPVPRYGFYSETDLSPATLTLYYQSPAAGSEITFVSWV